MEVDAPVPMELSQEDIERAQSAQHFRSVVKGQNYKAKTVVKNDSVLVWKIPQIREYFDVYFERICTNKFSPSRLSVNVGNNLFVKFAFKLWYDPSTEIDPYNEGFNFHIQPKEWNKQKVKELYGKYCLEFLDRNGQPFFQIQDGPINWLKRTYDYPHEDVDMHSLFLEFRKRDVLELEGDKLGGIDTLTVRLTFTKLTADILEVPNEKRLYDQVANVEHAALNLDMEKLLVDPRDSDVEIETSDGAIFPTHKLVLQLRAPMFRAMLDTDMLESKTGRVKTPELSSVAMRIILHFIYTGKLHLNWSNWRGVLNEVLSGAKQYGLEGLVNYYDKLLITLCNDTDVESLLEIAKLYELKQATADLENYKKGIIVT